MYLVGEFPAVGRQTSAAGACGVAALDHESGDDAVELLRQFLRSDKEQ